VVNKPKNKGTAAETAVNRFAQKNGFPGSVRNPLTGSKDCGDLMLCPQVIVEVKADKGLDYPRFLRETQAERENAGAAVGICVVKPPGVAEGRMPRWWMLLDAGTYDALEFLAGSNNFMASWLTQSEMVDWAGKRPLKFKPGELLAQKTQHLSMMPGTKLKPGAARVSRTGWDMRFLYLSDGLELLRWAGFGLAMGTSFEEARPEPIQGSRASETFIDEQVNWGAK
jgi:hypothetical protein